MKASDSEDAGKNTDNALLRLRIATKNLELAHAGLTQAIIDLYEDEVNHESK